jgi:hypothetical protein
MRKTTETSTKLYVHEFGFRTQAGRLHLVDSVGNIPLADDWLFCCTLNNALCTVLYLMTPWLRTQAGRLHLVDSVGKIPLADVTLVEDPAEDERNDDGKIFCYEIYVFCITFFSL